ncbi:MAG: DotH/IcmK family type IV secretion protein [Alphaproteobacteria bacterium]
MDLKSTLRLSSLCLAGYLIGGYAAISPALAQGPFDPPPSAAADYSDNTAQTQQNLLPPGPDFGLSADQSFDFESSAETLEEEVRKEAFDAALQGLLPLRPEEIRALLERFDTTQEAVEKPIYAPPKPEFAVETIPLDPGSAPISVKVAYGHVTTINILDISGQTWPIEDITWAGNFEVIDTTSNAISNIIRISPQSEFAAGNMSLKLIDLATPVVLTLETSRESVHYRFDAVIPEYGPNGAAPIIQTGITTTAGDKDMTSILQGVIPNGAKRMNVEGVDGRTSAYNFNGMTVLRTPLTLLSPGWDSSVASADGTRVYTFQQTPVVLLSERGKMVRVRLSERGDYFDE